MDALNGYLCAWILSVDARVRGYPGARFMVKAAEVAAGRLRPPTHGITSHRISYRRCKVCGWSGLQYTAYARLLSVYRPEQTVCGWSGLKFKVAYTGLRYAAGQGAGGCGRPGTAAAAIG